MVHLFRHIFVVVEILFVLFSLLYIVDGQLSLPKCHEPIFIEKNSSIVVYSPNYPRSYPQGTACMYLVSVSDGYGIDALCHIDIAVSHIFGCTTEHFLISQLEDPNFEHVEHFCGKQVLRRSSTYNTITLGYVSMNTCNSSQTGYFQCKMTSRLEPCDCGWNMDTKIVGGVEAKINEFPFMAAIVDAVRKAVICGGSIISHNYIVTAAHCVTKYHSNNLGVLLGDHNIKTGQETTYTQLVRVQQIITHENYDYTKNLNDIALLRTAYIKWTLGVGPICLPFLYRFADFAGYNVEIVGWGAESLGGSQSNVLMKATTEVFSSADCNSPDSIMCTYSNSSDSCQFDSGGPVILSHRRMFLVGVISFGRGCQGLGFNTRITSYLDWIESKTAKCDFCKKTL